MNKDAQLIFEAYLIREMASTELIDALVKRGFKVKPPRPSFPDEGYLNREGAIPTYGYGMISVGWWNPTGSTGFASGAEYGAGAIIETTGFEDPSMNTSIGKGDQAAGIKGGSGWTNEALMNQLSTRINEDLLGSNPFKIALEIVDEMLTGKFIPAKPIGNPYKDWFGIDDPSDFNPGNDPGEDPANWWKK